MKTLSKITEAKGICGIYAIKNTFNDKIYIGSSVNIFNRLTAHKSCLKNNKHCNIHLQRAWCKFGEDRFQYLLVEKTPEKELLPREQHWMDFYNSALQGYNINPIAGSRSGYKMTDEAKQKVSEFQKGRPKSTEQKERMRVARIAREGFGVSAYKGLSYVTKKDSWEVRIKPNKSTKAIFLGSFKEEIEAAKNYDYHAIKHYGVGNCSLNFPNQDYSLFTPRKPSSMIA